MERDPGDLQRGDDDVPPASDEDARIDALLASLPPAPGILHIDDDDPEGDAEAMADFAAGRYVTHEKVSEWLRTVGTPDYRPMPREWLE